MLFSEDSDNRNDKWNFFLLMETIKRTTNKSIPTEMSGAEMQFKMLVSTVIIIFNQWW